MGTNEGRYRLHHLFCATAWWRVLGSGMWLWFSLIKPQARLQQPVVQRRQQHCWLCGPSFTTLPTPPTCSGSSTNCLTSVRSLEQRNINPWHIRRSQTRHPSQAPADIRRRCYYYQLQKLASGAALSFHFFLGFINGLNLLHLWPWPVSLWIET